MKWKLDDVEIDALKNLVSEGIRHFSDFRDVERVGQRILDELEDAYIIVNIYDVQDTDCVVEKWKLNETEIYALKDLVSAGIVHFSDFRDIEKVGQRIFDELEDENIKVDIYPIPF